MMLVVELMTNGNLRDYIPPIRSRYIQTHSYLDMVDIAFFDAGLLVTHLLVARRVEHCSVSVSKWPRE